MCLYDSHVAKYWPEFQSKDSGLMKKKQTSTKLSKTNNISGTYNHQIQMFIKY